MTTTTMTAAFANETSRFDAVIARARATGRRSVFSMAALATGVLGFLAAVL